MSIFNKKVEDTLGFLQQESQGIVDIFSKALKDLGDVNAKALLEREATTIEIAELKQKEQYLQKLEDSNLKIITNINKFFE